jgi:hypothetical protein
MSTLSIRGSIFAAVLTLAPLSPASLGQDAGMVAQVNVPFDFQTDSQHFAPGLYRIRMENAYTVQIQGASESWLVMVRAEDNAQAVKTGKAVFHRYGNQYFLNEITVAGSSRHVHLNASKAERQMRIVHNNQAPAAVELSLLQGPR